MPFLSRELHCELGMSVTMEHDPHLQSIEKGREGTLLADACQGKVGKCVC